MKVLVITYYWPPAGGSGVQRWLKFTKYMSEFGLTPIVYTPENPSYPSIDFKIDKDFPDIEILKQPIFNPQDLLPKKEQTSSGVANISKGGLLSWIRGNFFIPDAKIFWIRPSVNYLKEYIKENKIDAIISSGPPHSMHLIAQRLRKETEVPWIADFRDPWTTLYYNEGFNLTNYAKSKNLTLEQKVLQSADAIVTVSAGFRDDLPVENSKVTIIANGFDDEVYLKECTLDTKFSISHIGLLPRQSNPDLLWEVLCELSQEVSSFKDDLHIRLIGNVCDEAISEIANYGLSEYLELTGYISHNEAVRMQHQAQVLLLLIPKTTNPKGILTGKVYEYMNSNRPILAIGAKGSDLDSLLQETQTGVLVDFEDKQVLKKYVLEYYQKYKSNTLKVVAKGVERYHRKALTKKLVALIEETIQSKR